MAGKILDLSSLTDQLERELAARQKKIKPVTLFSLQAGKSPGSEVYIKNQKNLAKKIGVDFNLCRLAARAKEKEAIAKIKEANKQKRIRGIIVNRPFPKNWNPLEIFSSVSPDKDIEGMSPNNLGKLIYGESGFVSPTALSVLTALQFLKADLYGKAVTIVGFSDIIGKPLVFLLGNRFATVSLTHIATYKKKKLPFYLKHSDIVITAVGKPHFIKADWIKKGSIVIDVGIAKKDSRITGDVEFPKALKKAAFVTPVPGGIGRLTSLFLFKNLLK